MRVETRCLLITEIMLILCSFDICASNNREMKNTYTQYRQENQQAATIFINADHVKNFRS